MTGLHTTICIHIKQAVFPKCEGDPTGYATSWKQVSNEEMEEVFGSSQEFLALMIGSEGR